MIHKKLLVLLFLTPLIASCDNILGFISVKDENKEEHSEQIHDIKIDLSNLTSFSWNVTDAYSLGIGEKKAKKTRAPEDPRPLELLKQKIEKYNGVIPDLETVSVGIAKTQSCENLNTYTSFHIAKRKDDDFNVIEEVKFEEDKIIVKTDLNHSYRILNNEFCDDSGWIRGNGDYITFKIKEEGKESIQQYKVYVRSEDSIITIEDFEKLTYTIKDADQNIIVKDIRDNDPLDCNLEEGVISIEGLTEDETYQVEKTGYIEEIQVDSENIEFGIERIYVYNSQYTFVTFVGKGQSQRGESGEYETTDISGAEYRDWWIYNARDEEKFFLLDNTTGQLLPIEWEGKVKIVNKIISQDREVLDLVVGDDTATFVPIGYASSGGAKDRYGNRLLENSQSGFVDKEKRIITTESNYAYYYSQEGEIFRQKKDHTYEYYEIFPLERLNEELEFVSLTSCDNATDLRYLFSYPDIYRDCLPYEIKNGKTYFAPISQNPIMPDSETISQYLYAEMNYNDATPSLLCKFDITEEERTNYVYNFNAYSKYDVVLCVKDQTVYQIKNLKEYLKAGGSTKPSDILGDKEIIQIKTFGFDKYDDWGYFQFYDGDTLRTVRPKLVIDGNDAHYDMVEKDLWGQELDRIYFQQI